MRDHTDMTPEERFTKMENLLAAMTEHHAQHDEDIRQIRETQIASEAVILQVTKTTRKTAQVLLRLAEAQEATEERLKALKELVDQSMRGPEESPA